ncbi:hypothetical protein KBY79_12990 [Synechococcus lacustris C3-12m-Tous]|uniref:hypothetical protein n=1 Tax=Synechococcus lacustris TaxID=2116544 RepID=UPI0020CECFEF|nr:hypothetical protein [Synechococcus lacustris]MCP9926122.1 hypothetical protein [Synechococcus lacustris C3-12m-Tous]
MEQITISSGDGQPASNHNSTTDLLNRLNLPTPTRRPVMQVPRNGVPRAVGKGCVALFPGLEMP